MTFDIGLHVVCVLVGVLYVITKFSRMDSLPNFLTHGAPLRARFARAGAPLLVYVTGLHAVQFGNNWIKDIPRTLKIRQGRRPTAI